MTTKVKTIALSAILLSSIPAIAGSSVAPITIPETTTESGWHYKAALYAWGENLEGDMTLRGRDIDVDLALDDILDNLDFAVMGAVEVGYDRWSFLADMSYADLSGSKDTQRTTIKTDLSQFIGNFVVAYNLVDTEPTKFDIYLGGRVNSLDLDVEVETQKMGSLEDSNSRTWVDPVIGVRYQRELSDKFLFRAVGDVGGFSIASDFTWQAMASFGYRVNDCSSVLLGYRGIGTDYSDGDFAYDVINHGVVLGYEYTF